MGVTAEGRGEHLPGILEVALDDAECRQGRYCHRHGLHRGIDMTFVSPDRNGIFHVAGRFGTGQVFDINKGIGNPSFAEFSMKTGLDNQFKFPGENIHHQGLRRIHIALRRPRGEIADGDHRLVRPLERLERK